MKKIAAKNGVIWIKHGFRLFRKQPTELSLLFLIYMLSMFLISYIPILGQLIPFILIPLFSMSFMQACVLIEKEEKVNPNLFLFILRDPAIISLLTLGGFYLLAAIISIAASSIIDGGMFWKLMSGQIQSNEIANEDFKNLPLSMLFSIFVYIPFAMGFWYAAPLTTWQRMSLLKSIFYSFFAVYNSGRAFIIYILGWITIGITLPAFISGILGLILGHAFVAVIILMPLSIVLTIVMYCSFYPTYTDIFDNPDNLIVEA